MTTGYDKLVTKRNKAQEWFNDHAEQMEDHEKAYFKLALKYATTPAHFQSITMLAKQVQKR